MDIVFDWNGHDFPSELKKLPEGRYVVMAANDAHRLTAEEEAGIEKAMKSIAEGNGVSLEEARQRIERLVRP